MKQYLELLGYKVRDIVTGFEGVVISIDFDLYGCVQAAVQNGLDKEGNPGQGKWFDTKRLVKTTINPVMAVPTFEVVPGGFDKPDKPEKPIR